MAMPIQQTPMTPFNTGSTAPPPYTANLHQPQPSQGIADAPGNQPNGFPQQQQAQFQQPTMVPQQQFQPQQTQIFQSPLTPQPMAPPQQPLQYPPNMTPEQQTQVQQMIQNMPPDKLQMYQQQAQELVNQQQPQPQTQLYQQPLLPGQAIPPQPQPPQYLPQGPQYASAQGPPPSRFNNGKKNKHDTGPKDEKQSSSVQRFLGDTLFGRVGRASVQTVTSALRMPASLSPWGDNNPVTLPNVRYRDAVLFTTFAFVGAPLVDGISDGVTGAFGADSFVSEIVSSGAATITGSTIIKYSVFQIVEQAIDKGVIEHLLPEEEKMLETKDVKSLQVGIKHKLMGVDADLRFWGVYPTRNEKACEKGWFCPYLFASARTPQVPRANDFGMACFYGPFLGGDFALTTTALLPAMPSILSFCPSDPRTDIGTNRLLLFFTGISPYRGNMWSTSRRPGCGTLIFHLMDGCPGLVIPVTSNAPICAWSPWTLSEMRAWQAAQMMGMGPKGLVFNTTSPGIAGFVPGQPAPPTMPPSVNMNMNMGGPPGYSPEWQHEQICEWLDSIISVPHINPAIRDRYVEVLGRSVSLVINGALALDRPNVRPLLGKLDPERAGIVAFRY